MKHKYRFKKQWRTIAGKKYFVPVMICKTDDCPNVKAHKKLIK